MVTYASEILSRTSMFRVYS